MIDLALGPKLFISNNMDAAIQELDLLFSSEIGEVIGDVGYGSNWHQFLYVLTPMEDSLTRYIRDLIQQHTYYVKRMKYDVFTQYIPGDVTCSYVVSISLEDYDEPAGSPNKKTNKTYTIR